MIIGYEQRESYIMVQQVFTKIYQWIMSLRANLETSTVSTKRKYSLNQKKLYTCVKGKYSEASALIWTREKSRGCATQTLKGLGD